MEVPDLAPHEVSTKTQEPAALDAPSKYSLASRLQCQGEVLSPALKALLENQQLTPQQAMGSLATLSEVVGRILCNLEDPEALEKFRRIKAAVLRKKLGTSAELAFRVLEMGGFATSGEHLVWEECDGSLLASVALNTAIADLQQRFKEGGARAIHGLETLVLSPAAVLAMTNNTSLLPRAGAAACNSVGTPLLQQAWLENFAPDLAKALALNTSLADAPNMREKAAARQVRRDLAAHREAIGCARLQCAPLLDELAQLLAAFDRVQKRRGSERRHAETLDVPLIDSAQAEAPPQAAPPLEDGAVDSSNAFARSAQETLEILLRCVPAFRLGPAYSVLVELVRLREYPSFFTSGLNEKQFITSLETMVGRVVDNWKGGSGQALGAPEWAVVGVGCSMDITHDDCMLIWAIFA